MNDVIKVAVQSYTFKVDTSRARAAVQTIIKCLICQWAHCAVEPDGNEVGKSDCKEYIYKNNNGMTSIWHLLLLFGLDIANPSAMFVRGDLKIINRTLPNYWQRRHGTSVNLHGWIILRSRVSTTCYILDSALESRLVGLKHNTSDIQ